MEHKRGHLRHGMHWRLLGGVLTGMAAFMLAAAQSHFLLFAGGGLVGLAMAVTLFCSENRRLDALEKAGELSEELKRVTNSDKLTELANRRYAHEYLLNEFKRARREGTPLALLLVDIDCFAQYNEHYGRSEGDECLVNVASTLQQACKRPGDLAARYGDDMFLLVLPNTENALVMAEQLRTLIETLGIAHAASSLSNVVTVSVGLSTVTPAEGMSADELIARAEGALYEAKKSGKNRVVEV